MTTLRIAFLSFALVAGVVASIGTPSSTRANGVPQLVKLTYLDGISTTGAKDAEGVLEFSFAEAYAKATADGLDAPEATQSYQGWLIKSGSADALNVGVFTIESTGLARLDETLPVISDYSYDFFVITLEEQVVVATQPGAAKTIGGFFSIIKPEATSVPASTDTQDPNTSAESKPSTLPATGAADGDSAMIRSALLLVLILVSISLSLRVGRRYRRGEPS